MVETCIYIDTNIYIYIYIRSEYGAFCCIQHLIHILPEFWVHAVMYAISYYTRTGYNGVRLYVLLMGRHLSNIKWYSTIQNQEKQQYIWCFTVDMEPYCLVYYITQYILQTHGTLLLLFPFHYYHWICWWQDTGCLWQPDITQRLFVSCIFTSKLTICLNYFSLHISIIYINGTCAELL